METINKLIQIPLNLELSDCTMKVSSKLAKFDELYEVLRYNADIFT